MQKKIVHNRTLLEAGAREQEEYQPYGYSVP